MHTINCWNCGCSVPIGNDGPQSVAEVSRVKVSDDFNWMDDRVLRWVPIEHARILLAEVRRLEELLARK